MIRRPRKTSSVCGFTLIELLVVIAVISVLLAILLPALGTARQLAKRTRCVANVREISMGWLMYFDENDGKFFRGWRPPSSADDVSSQDPDADIHYGGWRGDHAYYPRPLNKSLGLPGDIQDKQGAQLFHCPADRGGAPGRFYNEELFNLKGTSYRANPLLVGTDTYIPYPVFEDLDRAIMERLPNLKVTSVSNHSKLLLIGDFGWFHQWEPLERDAEILKRLAWHGKSEHYVMGFLDGHARYMRISQGQYVANDYAVLPFQEFYGLARELQSLGD